MELRRVVRGLSGLGAKLPLRDLLPDRCRGCLRWRLLQPDIGQIQLRWMRHALRSMLRRWPLRQRAGLIWPLHRLLCLLHISGNLRAEPGRGIAMLRSAHRAAVHRVPMRVHRERLHSRSVRGLTEHAMRFSLLRGDDFLAIEFETLDMQLESRPAGPPVLVPQGAQPRLIVRFPPQHIAERAFAPAASITGMRARIAGGSQLVFRVNGELPFTVASLLDWSAPRLTPLLPLATGALDPLVTQIELPYRILLAPDTEAIWRHNLLPITRADTDGNRWTELWQ